MAGGYVGIPYLQGAQIAVTFKDIVVNTDNRLVEGFFETKYDTKNNNLLVDAAVIEEVIKKVWDGIKDTVGDLYDKVKGNDRNISEFVDEFIKEVSESIKENKDLTEEEKQQVLDILDVNEFEESLAVQIEKIKNEELNRNEFIASVNSNFIDIGRYKMNQETNNISPELQEKLNKIMVQILSIGDNGCAFIQNKKTSQSDIELNNTLTIESIDYLTGKYENNNVFFNTAIENELVDVKTQSGLSDLLSSNTVKNFILYVENGVVKGCFATEDYSEFTTLNEAKDNPTFQQKFITDLLKCKTEKAVDNKFILETLQKLQSYAYANQEIEFVHNGIAYTLKNGEVNRSDLSDEDINTGNWTDGAIDTKIRFGFDENGIVQVKAFGFRKDLRLADGKTANLPELASHIKEQTNKFLVENRVNKFDLESPVFKDDRETFADGKQIIIGGKNTGIIKIVTKGVGLGTTLLKTARIEEDTYLDNPKGEVIIAIPGMGTGVIEAGVKAITDITEPVAMLYDLAVDKEARTEAYNGLGQIKEQVKDDPTSLFPLLGEIILEEFSGNTSEEWQEANSDQTDNGRQSHLLTKGTVRTIASVFASGKFLAKVPDMADDLAKKMAKVKNIALETLEQVRKHVDDLLHSKIGKIKKLYPNAKIGYRGSLATGTKYSTGGVFDPKDWDVDAFIVSDELYEKLPAGWKNAKDIPEINTICSDIEKDLKNISGYRTSPGKEFTFKVWSTKEYEEIVKQTAHKIF